VYIVAIREIGSVMAATRFFAAQGGARDQKTHRCEACQAAAVAVCGHGCAT